MTQSLSTLAVSTLTAASGGSRLSSMFKGRRQVPARYQARCQTQPLTRLLEYSGHTSASHGHRSDPEPARCIGACNNGPHLGRSHKALPRNDSNAYQAGGASEKQPSGRGFGLSVDPGMDLTRKDRCNYDPPHQAVDHGLAGMFSQPTSMGGRRCQGLIDFRTAELVGAHYIRFSVSMSLVKWC